MGLRWHERTLAATFEPFIERRQDGTIRFANRALRSGEPFLRRHWPVFSLVKRSRQTLRPPIALRRAGRVSRQITTSSRLCEARHWLPCNPLDAHAMKIEDARLARWKPTRFSCR